MSSGQILEICLRKTELALMVSFRASSVLFIYEVVLMNLLIFRTDRSLSIKGSKNSFQKMRPAQMGGKSLLSLMNQSIRRTALISLSVDRIMYCPRSTDHIN